MDTVWVCANDIKSTAYAIRDLASQKADEDNLHIQKTQQTTKQHKRKYTKCTKLKRKIF